MSSQPDDVSDPADDVSTHRTPDLGKRQADFDEWKRDRSSPMDHMPPSDAEPELQQ